MVHHLAELRGIEFITDTLVANHVVVKHLLEGLESVHFVVEVEILLEVFDTESAKALNHHLSFDFVCHCS